MPGIELRFVQKDKYFRVFDADDRFNLIGGIYASSYEIYEDGGKKYVRLLNDQKKYVALFPLNKDVRLVEVPE